MTRRLSLLFTAIIMLAATAGCTSVGSDSTQHMRSLQQIQDSGRITVLTAYGSMSYFLDDGKPAGAQYLAACRFAEFIGVEMDVVVAENPAQLVHMLREGQGDLIAYDLPMTLTDKDSVLYCGKQTITHQVMVQSTGPAMLTDITELVGKTVYARQGRHYDRMVSLNDELGGGLDIHEVTADSISAEDLIEKVAKGEIAFAVADNDEARLARTFYRNIDINLTVSFDQRSSWAVAKDNTTLAEAIEQWAAEDAADTTDDTSTYYGQSRNLSMPPILSIRDGRISPFDDIFRRYSQEVGWDWRLMASLAYTESNFNPDIVSRSGAQGLMQLMPATAHIMGVPVGKERDPEESIRAASRYIAYADSVFRAVPPAERVKFVLAAYNSGIGHVQDAMALAEKYGGNKYMWDGNTGRYLILKSKEEYYTDPVCKNGYLRGTDTDDFVQDVMVRYARYRGLVAK